MPKPILPFLNWLKQFENDNTPIGDFARDVRDDEHFPKSGGWEAIAGYLDWSIALDTAEKAWRQYQTAPWSKEADPSISERVIVGNVRKPVPEGYTRVYVGRRTTYKPQYGEDFSVLGNPYPVGPKYTRDEAIAAYACLLRVTCSTTPAHLAIAALYRRVEQGEKLALMCWCAPQACHADVIKRVLMGGKA